MEKPKSTMLEAKTPVSLQMCAACGASVVASLGTMSQRKIEWDDTAREFHVSFVFKCPVCGRGSASKDLMAIPLRIAKASNCSCGGPLRLSDHSIHEKGDVIEFTGVYVCVSCGNKRNSIAKMLLSALSRVWNDTKEVEIGTRGFKFKKRANELHNAAVGPERKMPATKKTATASKKRQQSQDD